MNLATWVQRNGRLRPDSPALAVGATVFATWAQWAATTRAIAGGLAVEYALGQGDRVAIVMRNRPEYLEALFGIWHAGLVAVPVNARLHPDEIAYILRHSGSRLVLTDPEHADDVAPLVTTVDDVQAAIVAPGADWARLCES